MPSPIQAVLTHLWRHGHQQRTASPTLAEQFDLEFSRHGWPERYRQARDRPVAKESPGWKTLGGGAAVEIGEDGQIIKGCPGLKGEDVDDLEDESDESRDEREQRQDVAESHGLEGHEVAAEQAQDLDEQPEGQAPTPESPQTVTIQGQEHQVSQQHGLWFFRRPPETAWTMASSGLRELIEQGLQTGQPQRVNPPAVPSKQTPARRAQTRLQTAVSQTAQDYSVEPRDLHAAAQEVHRAKRRQLSEREAAKGEARRMTGLTQRDIGRMENAGHDYTSKQIGGATGQKLRQLDVWATELARQYPELELGNPDDPQADLAGPLWDLLGEGQQAVPPVHHPEILQEAAELVLRSRVEPQAADPVPFRRQGMVQRYRRLLAREYEARRVIARYQRSVVSGITGTPVHRYAHKPSAGQASFAWNEDDHPRADDGRFGTKSGEHKDESQGPDGPAKVSQEETKPKPKEDKQVDETKGKATHNITWTAPADSPVPGIGGQTFTGGIVTVFNGELMVDFGYQRIGGKPQRLRARVKGKPDLAAAIEQAKAADTATEEEEAATLDANVPGLEALRAARMGEEEYQGAFQRMMESEGNDGANPPRKPATSVKALAAQYPRAALYVRAEGYERASHWAKSKAGTEAMAIIAAGGDLADAASKLDNWLSDNNVEVD